ncbi:uncharacterized protein LOC131929541 [Physella acuta]|uniref:uncharacterized protein LOC131929541 n=1 Tax=Physella acuta TaxID=109671 RepID=UPI0027DC0319|nr:uncharacterized protein LOC131929541 [Physella acuta]
MMYVAYFLPFTKACQTCSSTEHWTNRCQTLNLQSTLSNQTPTQSTLQKTTSPTQPAPTPNSQQAAPLAKPPPTTSSQLETPSAQPAPSPSNQQAAPLANPPPTTSSQQAAPLAKPPPTTSSQQAAPLAKPPPATSSQQAAPLAKPPPTTSSQLETPSAQPAPSPSNQQAAPLANPPPTTSSQLETPSAQPAPSPSNQQAAPLAKPPPTTSSQLETPSAQPAPSPSNQQATLKNPINPAKPPSIPTTPSKQTCAARSESEKPSASSTLKTNTLLLFSDMDITTTFKRKKEDSPTEENKITKSKKLIRDFKHCRFCLEQCKSSREREKHERSIHYRCLQCDLCADKGHYPDILSHFAENHQEETMYDCRDCNLSLPLESMRAHTSVHHKKK